MMPKSLSTLPESASMKTHISIADSQGLIPRAKPLHLQQRSESCVLVSRAVAHCCPGCCPQVTAECPGRPVKCHSRALRSDCRIPIFLHILKFEPRPTLQLWCYT